MVRLTRLPLVRLLPALAAGVEHAVGDHLHRRVEVEVLPLRPVRTAVPDRRDPGRAGDQRLARAALGAQPAAVDRRVRVALDLDDLLVLHVDVLRAADGAVRADALDDAVGGRGARHHRLGRLAARGLAAAQRIGAGQLPVHRPGVEPGLHPRNSATRNSAGTTAGVEPVTAELCHARCGPAGELAGDGHARLRGPARPRADGGRRSGATSSSSTSATTRGSRSDEPERTVRTSAMTATSMAAQIAASRPAVTSVRNVASVATGELAVRPFRTSGA